MKVAFLVKDGKTPATLVTFLANVLLTDAAPENVIVSEGLPLGADLSSATEGRGIEVTEDLDADFPG